MKNVRLLQRLLIIALLLIVILGLGTCYGYRKDQANQAMINDLQAESLSKDQRFIERIKLDSTREYTQNQLLSSERNARVLAEDRARGFKHIQSVVKANLVYIHDTIVAEYTDHITDSSEMVIPIGTKFAEISKYDTITGIIKANGIEIVRTPTNLGEMTTIIGSEKYGFMKLKSKPVVNVSFSNPNVRVTGMANVVVKQNKPKRLAWLISGLAVGLTGGILLMTN